VVFFPVKRILLQKWHTPSFLEESGRKHRGEKKRDFIIILLFFAFTAVLWPKNDFAQKREETLFSKKAEKR
tara:strand:- start:121 stop:333 length:213 start_codon:yes stop_codon:yes gene_type:complete